MIGIEICNLLSFITLSLVVTVLHEYTTSTNRHVLQIMYKNEVFRQNAAIFHSSTNKEEIVTAGENAMKILYDGVREISLNRLRFHKFVSKTM